ncbi:phage regulatory CII family protein [Rhizobium sp. SL86]|uniref:phage regulatory CII family protein n=1 Tax=Rhizobium sp. SL86 TaxID=2995148 RepID=UPI002DD42E36|nr:phage regulatory CII family protein [Rhizobium sp. SL86]
MADRGAEFAQLIYQLLVVEKRVSVEQAARAIGMGTDALYARLNGRTVFSADEIAALLGSIPDPRPLAYLVKQSRYLAVERVSGALDDPETDIIRATHRILLEAADVLEAVDTAIHDGRIDHRDALVIQREIEVAERALVSLREHVRALA